MGLICSYRFWGKRESKFLGKREDGQETVKGIHEFLRGQFSLSNYFSFPLLVKTEKKRAAVFHSMAIHKIFLGLNCPDML